ncbi:MAG: SDR family NAD(P)-dependent oxidoreductase [Opitutales bacterium]
MNCLLTGASRGIGLALARHFHGRGHKVAITGRKEQSLAEAKAILGDDVLTIAGDAADPATAERTVREVEAQLGPLDLLVNNAGITGPVGTPFLEADPAAWWRTLEVNLRGPMSFMRAALPGMRARGRGTIVNMGSYGALFDLPGGSAYGVSKSALARLTDAVAAEIVDTGVHLFCTSPGLVKTDMTRDADTFDHLPPEAWSQPEDICHLIERLTDPACGVLHGRFLHVKDDLDRLLAQAAAIHEKGLYKLCMHGLDGRIG